MDEKNMSSRRVLSTSYVPGPVLIGLLHSLLPWVVGSVILPTLRMREPRLGKLQQIALEKC